VIVVGLPTVGVHEHARREGVPVRTLERNDVHAASAPTAAIKLFFLISDFLLWLREVGHLVAERECSH